jgi:hypothetical protein
MPLTITTRHATNPFEASVCNEVSNLTHDGFLTNTILLPNVTYRFYPDEHDALLLLPWAAYTLDAKGWAAGTYRFPMNNPVEYTRSRPPADPVLGWRRQANLPNPFHVAKQKGSALHAYCRRARSGVENLPILPLIVFPDHCDFTPDQDNYVPSGGGPPLNLRILKLGQMNARIDADAATMTGTRYGLPLLETLLRRLEAERRRPYEGLAMCGFHLEQLVDRKEPGCPVRFVTYQSMHEFTATKAEVRLYDKYPANVSADRFLDCARRRATALHRCSIPTVVRLLNVEELPDLLLMAFERYDGETLQEVVGRRQHLSEGLVRSLLIHLARSVQALHEQGIIHLDLRPEYILLGDGLDGHGGADHRLTGLTNPLIDTSQISTAVYDNNFDASFASFEMRAHGHSNRGQAGTDIFSLGRLAAYCLLGHVRYRDAVVGTDLDSVRFDLSGIGQSLRRIVERAMELRPEHRHPAARDLADELVKL